MLEIQNRPSYLVEALHYGLLDKETIDRYKPHVLMFNRYHIETIVYVGDDWWQVFNKENMKDLYNEIGDQLEHFYHTNKVNPVDIYEMVYPDRGIYSNLFDPIPEELFMLGMTSSDMNLPLKHDLSSVIQNTIPLWMRYYSTISLFAYIDGKFVRKNPKSIRKDEGYDDYENFLTNF